jgi:ABC-type uncharacterized transport system permease subunit
MGGFLQYWRIYLIAIGAIAAWAGVTIYGLGNSYREPRDFDVNVGIGLIVGGLAVLVVGVIAYMTRPEDQR